MEWNQPMRAKGERPTHWTRSPRFTLCGRYRRVQGCEPLPLAPTKDSVTCCHCIRLLRVKQ